MTKTTLFSIAGALTLVLAAGLWAQETKDTTAELAVKKWQHLALEQDGPGLSKDPEFARKINRLGNDGWELVNVETVIKNGSTKGSIFFFKRPN